MKTQHVSPLQFDLLHRGLQWMELHGYGPEASVIGACNWARMEAPTPFEPMEIIVDPELAKRDFVRGLVPVDDARSPPGTRRGGVMARYQQLYVEAEEKLLRRLEKERSSIDRLTAHKAALDAAITVLQRHKLITEFADEISRINAIVGQQKPQEITDV